MVRVKDRPSGAAPSAVWSSQLGVGRVGGGGGGGGAEGAVKWGGRSQREPPGGEAPPGLPMVV